MAYNWEFLNKVGATNRFNTSKSAFQQLLDSSGDTTSSIRALREMTRKNELEEMQRKAAEALAQKKNEEALEQKNLQVTPKENVLTDSTLMDEIRRNREGLVDLSSPMPTVISQPKTNNIKLYNTDVYNKSTASVVGEEIKNGFLNTVVGVTKFASLLSDMTYGENKTAKRFLQDVDSQRAKAQEGLASTTGIKKTLGSLAQGVGTSLFSVAFSPLAIPAIAASSMGEGIDEALKYGADNKSAVMYGMLRGAIEGGAESIFSGIPLVKGIIPAGVQKTIASKMSSGLMKKVVSKIPLNVLGEGVEEVLSAVLTPYAKRATYDKKAETASAKEVMESFVMGVAVAGVLNMPASVVNLYGKAKTKIDAKQKEKIIKEVEASITEEERQKYPVIDEPAIQSIIEERAEQVANGEELAPVQEDVAPVPQEEEEQYQPVIMFDDPTRDTRATKILSNAVDVYRNKYGVADADARILPEAEMTAGERTIADFYTAFGRKVYVYDGKNIAGGLSDPKASPDIILVKRGDAVNGMNWAVGHEFVETTKTTSPELYNELVTYVSENVDAEQKLAYVTKLTDNAAMQNDLLNNPQKLVQEMIADEGGNLLSSKGFWKQLREQSLELFDRLADAVMRFLNRVGGMNIGNYMSKQAARDVRKKIATIIEAERTANESGKVVKGKQAEIKEDITATVRNPMDNPNFQAWFGDSKAVDENGKPLVLFYGAGREFKAFDEKTARIKGGYKGFVFTTDADNASAYSEEPITEKEKLESFVDGFNEAKRKTRASFAMEKAYKQSSGLAWSEIAMDANFIDDLDDALSVTEQIIDYAEEVKDSKVASNFKEFLQNFQAKNNTRRFMLTNLSVQNPVVVNATRETFERAMFRAQNMAKPDNDGIQINLEDGEKVFVVFEPNQIKSATDNAGTYDANNPDITASVRNPMDKRTTADIIAANTPTNLLKYTDVLYRETDASGLIDMADPMALTDAPYYSPLYFSNNQDLALGQKDNKGFIMKLKADGLKGVVNTSKPAWNIAYENGSAEFIAQYNKKTNYMNNIESITVMPGAKADKVQKTKIKRFLSSWGKTTNEDGSVTYFRPDITATPRTPQDFKTASQKRADEMYAGRKAAEQVRKDATADKQKAERREYDQQAKRVRDLYRERDALEQAIARLLDRKDAQATAQAERYQQRLNKKKQQIEAERKRLREYKFKMRFKQGEARVKDSLKKNIRVIRQMENRPNKVSHANVDLADVISAMSTELNKAIKGYTGDSKADMSVVLDKYQELIDANVSGADGVMLDRIRYLQGVDMQKLETDGLVKLNDLVSHLVFINRNANKMLKIDKNATTDQAAKKLYAETSRMKDGQYKDSKATGWARWLYFAPKSFITKLRAIGRYIDESVMGMFADAAEDVANKKADMKRDDYVALKELVAPYADKVKDWGGKEAPFISVKLQSGKTMDITAFEAMYLYLGGKREHIRTEAAKSGFVIDNRLRKGSTKEKTEYILTDADFKAIEKMLTPEQKKVADLMSGWFNTVAKDRINDTTMKTLGFKAARDAFYVPSVRDGEYFGARDVEQQSYNTAWDLNGLGILQETKSNVKQPMVVLDLSEAFYRHSEQTARYAASAEFASDFLHVFYSGKNADTSVRLAIKSAIGETSFKSLEQEIQNVFFGAMPDKNAANRFMNNMLSAYKKSVLASAKVMLKQVTSLPRSYVNYGFKYMKEGMNPRWKATRELMEKHSGLSFIRFQGIFNPELESNMAAKIAAGKSAVPLAYQGMQIMDNHVTMKTIWRSAQAIVHDQQPDLEIGSDEFYKATAVVFNDMMQSQLINDPYHAGEAFESRDFGMRALFSFKSETFKSLAMLEESFHRMKNKKDGESRKIFARNVTAVLINFILADVVINTAFDMFRNPGDDEEERKNKPVKYVARKLSSLFTAVIPFSEILTDFILDGRKIERMEFGGLYKALYGLADGFNSYADQFREEKVSKATLAGGTLKAITGVATMFGIPTEILAKDIESLARVTSYPMYVRWILATVSPATKRKNEDTGKFTVTGNTRYFDMLYEASLNNDLTDEYDMIYSALRNAGVSSESIRNSLRDRKKEAEK